MSRTIHLGVVELGLRGASTVLRMTAEFGPDVKGGFRRTARIRRASLAANHRFRASSAVARAVLERVAERPGLVGAYVAIGTELDLTVATSELARQGRLLLPRVVGDDLELVRWRTGDPLTRSSFGVPEPLGPACPMAEVATVLVPALAFDLGCHRLGYGRGFYDRLLAAEPSLLAIGVGFDVQVVDRLPAEPHDAPLDLVLTESRTITRGMPREVGH